jgi:hypothetical protein
VSWLSLSSVLAELQRHTSGLSSGLLPREAAAMLALTTYGERILELPALINCAALALRLTPLRVHEVRIPVPRLVAETDLHSLPDEPPRLLRSPVLVEVRSPGPELLFGDTACLGCYWLDDSFFLVGITYPDGVLVARWQPIWSGGELEEGVRVEPIGSPHLRGLAASKHHAWGVQAARFLTVLGLLLDAEGAPVATTDDPPRVRRSRSGDPPRPWGVTRIYLQQRGRSRGETPPPRGEAPTGLPTSVEVRGHLRRVPCGPGGTERRWRYIASYEARRWISPEPRRVVVSR